eukprot:1734165-Amphidinium_carterae.1
MQSRESCSRKDLPANIWDMYKKKSEFSVLTFTAIKGTSSAAAKAKAKSKAAAKPKAKSKAKAKAKK